MAAELLLTVAHVCVLIALDELDAEVGTPVVDQWMQLYRRTGNRTRINELLRHKLIDTDVMRTPSAVTAYNTVYRLNDKGRQAISSGITST